jgi:hypothetical protein
MPTQHRHSIASHKTWTISCNRCSTTSAVSHLSCLVKILIKTNSLVARAVTLSSLLHYFNYSTTLLLPVAFTVTQSIAKKRSTVL